jgi:hypothetical protein
LHGAFVVVVVGASKGLRVEDILEKCNGASRIADSRGDVAEHAWRGNGRKRVRVGWHATQPVADRGAFRARVERITATCSTPDRLRLVRDPAGLPLSNTTRHAPGASRRQTELKRPVTLPSGSRTSPVPGADVPDSRTSTRSGSHENGAAWSWKNRDHPAITSFLPRRTPLLPKQIASSETWLANAAAWRSAIDLAKARSAAKTCCCGVSGEGIAAYQGASSIASTRHVATRNAGLRRGRLE